LRADAPLPAEDGIEVVATGKLTTYPGRSKYQIVVDRLELAGQGALMALLDKRRRQLAAEGLFDQERKSRLPFLPRTIGVVTSPTGAVIRDILHRLADRCPSHVIVWPVAVQGEGAAAQIAAAVRGFNAMARRPDLLIVARGGGSIEDSGAFNEEEVVRAVAASEIPTISAVGHETDTTLCDFAADMRAPTPTAAAEIAVPVRAELLAQLRQSGLRMERCARRAGERAAECLEQALRRWPEREALLAPQQQRLDELAERLPRALSARLGHARADLNQPPARCARPCSTPACAAGASGLPPSGSSRRWSRAASTRAAARSRACGASPPSSTRTSRSRRAMRASRTGQAALSSRPRRRATPAGCGSSSPGPSGSTSASATALSRPRAALMPSPRPNSPSCSDGTNPC
jgi:exodeoxyribonuclease VII large subunit